MENVLKIKMLAHEINCQECLLDTIRICQGIEQFLHHSLQ